MTKGAFLDGIRSARVELDSVLARRDEGTLTQRHLARLNWTAKDVLAHLIGYDLAVLKAVADVRATGAWKWPWTAPSFDPWNESQVGPRRELTFAAVRGELDESRIRLLAELERWPEVSGPFGRDTWDLIKSRSSGSGRTSATTRR